MIVVILEAQIMKLIYIIILGTLHGLIMYYTKLKDLGLADFVVCLMV